MPTVNNSILLVGLGNPGQEYANTPHNLGRTCVASFFSAMNLSAKWKMEKNFNALLADGVAYGKHIFLMLPQTFMNNSGDAVTATAHYYKISPENIWVVHDEADLPLGALRVDFGASSAGHNGVKSIIEKLGTKDFWRFRIGIARKEPLVMPLDAYVLQKNAIPETAREEIIKKVSGLLSLALERGIEEAKKYSD